MPRVIADVFLPDGVNRRLPTTPGRSVQFFGGRAQVVDGRDMPHMLQMEGARVFPHEDSMAWANDWLQSTHEIKAQVNWPEGWDVSHTNQDEFRIVGPEVVVSLTSYGPEIPPDSGTIDLTDRQHGWINPNDLLKEPDDDPDSGAGSGGTDTTTPGSNGPESSTQGTSGEAGTGHSQPVSGSRRSRKTGAGS